MHKIFKYLKKFLREFDVSPFNSDNSLRLLIYAVWGFSVLMFLGQEFSYDADSYSYSYNSGQYTDCTRLKKINTFDIFVENITLVQTTQFIVISPINYELPSVEVKTPLSTRAPPYKLPG